MASDVYSLGCLLWTALTGRPPYAADTDFQVASAHLALPAPRLAGDSPLVREVDAVFGAALAKDPARRHPSAAVLRDHLRHALSLPGPAGVVAVPTAPASPPRGRRRRAAAPPV